MGLREGEGEGVGLREGTVTRSQSGPYGSVQLNSEYTGGGCAYASGGSRESLTCQVSE